MSIDLARNWWMVAVRGFVALLFGLATFIWPGFTLATLVLFFGAYALVDGAFAMAAAVLGQGGMGSWWALIAEGIAGVVVGVLTLFSPLITALALTYVVAAWALITGVFEIAAALRLRREIEGEWAFILSGVLSVFFGLMLVASPGSGMLVLLWMTGAYASFFGALLLFLAFRLRSLNGKQAWGAV